MQPIEVESRLGQLSYAFADDFDLSLSVDLDYGLGGQKFKKIKTQ